MAKYWTPQMIRSTTTEEGHAAAALAGLVGAAGAIALGIGAANDTGWLAIAGGIAAGVGILAVVLGEHMGVDYGIFGRLDQLEGKGKPEE